MVNYEFEKNSGLLRCESRKRPIYMEQGYALGKYMAEHNYELVFGAGSVGIMGAIQNGVLDHGGSAIGVMPRSLDDKEITSQRLTDLVLVDSLHGRKAKMSELADAFVLAQVVLGHWKSSLKPIVGHKSVFMINRWLCLISMVSLNRCKKCWMR